MKRPYYLLVVIGVAVRLLCLIVFDPQESLLGGDTPAFLAGSPAQAPGYSLVLAVIGNLWAVVALQMAMTIGISLLAYRRTGNFLFAALLAGSPFLVTAELRILSDTLAWQLVALALILLAWPRRWWDKLLAGLLLGSAALVRDTYYLLPLALLPFAWWAGSLRAALFAAAIAFATVLPWQLANNRIGISEGRSGYNLWVGTWEQNGDWMLPGLQQAAYPKDAFVGEQQRRWLLGPPLLSSESDRRFQAAAIDRIQSDPGFVLSRWAGRYWRLWIGTRSDQIEWRLTRGSLPWTLLKAGLWGLNLVTLLLGVIGVAIAARKHPLMVAPIAYLALLYVPFHNTETRYSLGALPFLYFFGALAMTRLFRGQHLLRLSRVFSWQSGRYL